MSLIITDALIPVEIQKLNRVVYLASFHSHLEVVFWQHGQNSKIVAGQTFLLYVDLSISNAF